MEYKTAISTHQCRSDCGACCIAPSISSPIPGMPDGKPANVRCAQLSEDLLCMVFDKSSRPKVCINFKFDACICGNSQSEAMRIMNELEK
ncbi:MAG: YkgJ family cysteine cluster protein [Bacteroidetes bacterium]|nr:YkgJ family cysteine cluster protein [Bacteroidota bacterium]